MFYPPNFYIFPREDGIFRFVQRSPFEEKKWQGIDTSNAERLDEQSQREFMSGNKEECKRMLIEAIEELEGEIRKLPLCGR